MCIPIKEWFLPSQSWKETELKKRPIWSSSIHAELHPDVSSFSARQAFGGQGSMCIPIKEWAAASRGMNSRQDAEELDDDIISLDMKMRFQV
ncbi:uncharacterized protein [Atheta coriaria]|uniref:uncharacterized protein isoform X2 n=1 Tax=Dalotia coriaria TaxID=877792 RepID=UPI0031F39E46